VACPDLVPLIERGSPFDSAIVDAVRHYTRPLREAEVDTVILGCTHYPLIRPLLQRMLGRGVQIVSSGVPVARQVEHVLGSRGLGNPRSGEGDYRFLTSADPDALRTSGTRFLQLPIGSVETVRSPATPAPARGGATAHADAARASPGRTARARRPTSPRRADERAAAQRRPRLRRAAARHDRARLRAHRDRLRLIACGGTRVICTASVQESVPRWMAGQGRGWMTAEYGMLPASTGERKQRDVTKGRADAAPSRSSA
jgi:hypothetical protein